MSNIEQKQLFESLGVINNRSKGSSSGADLKSVTKSFMEELDSLLKGYADPDEDMVVKGITIKAANKYGVAASYLFAQVIKEGQDRVSFITNMQSTIFNMEKDLTKAAS